MEDYTKFLKDKFSGEIGETSFGEPQIWLCLKSGRSIEITFESEGLPKEDWFYSVRLHCSEAELVKYAITCGVLDNLTGSCLSSAATALGMLLEMHGEELDV